MKYIPLSILLLMSVYVLKLAVNNQLIYYIHPRYVFFVIVAALVGLGVGALALWKQQLPAHAAGAPRFWLMLVLTAVLLLAIFLPAVPLQSLTLNKSVNADVAFLANPQNLPQSLANLQSGALTIRDWIILLYQQNANFSQYNGRAVDVIGFVYIEPGMNNSVSIQEFYVARFAIWCCVVDASLVGIPVENNEQADIQPDEWVEVKGVLSVVNTGGVERAVIVPSSVQKVAQPADPYLY